jgi:hypothetical protein
LSAFSGAFDIFHGRGETGLFLMMSLSKLMDQKTVHPRGFWKSCLFSVGVTTSSKIKHIHPFLVRIILMSSQCIWGMAGFCGPFKKIAKHLSELHKKCFIC